MEEAKQRVKQAGYADGPLEAYITYIKRWDKAASVHRFNPYMTVDGRVKEAKEANERFQIFTYFNTDTGDIRVSIGELGEIVVPARCCVAMFYDNSGHIHMGTASIGTEGMVDRTNPLENAETSAVGRALGLAGYGLIPGAGIASAEEMDEARSRQQQNDAPADLGSYRIRGGGWGKDRRFGGMTLKEVYEDSEGHGAMAWTAGLDDPSGDTKKMAQYFNMCETQKEEAESGHGDIVPEGVSLEEYEKGVTAALPASTQGRGATVTIVGRVVMADELLTPGWTNYVQQLLVKHTGPDELFGHSNHVINHLKSHYNVAKVMDLAGEKAAALVRYIESSGKDADPRWYAEPEEPTETEELFGSESVEGLLEKAAPHLPEAWRDKPEKWWAALLKQFDIGILNAKQLKGVRVLLLAVASGGIDLTDTTSDTHKMFLGQMQGIVANGVEKWREPNDG